MASTALVWLRRDLRLHDHPPLRRALDEHDRVVPVWVMDPVLTSGRFASGPRTGWVLDSLAELRAGLRERGGDLVVRTGRPVSELVRLAGEVGAQAVLWASDVSPYAVRRDRAVMEALRAAGVQPVPGPGLFVADIGAPRTKAGAPYTVYSPFGRQWLKAERREVLDVPDALPALPDGLDPGALPALADLGLERELTDPLTAGEAAGRARMEQFLADGVHRYHEGRNRLAGGASVLAPYLRHGNLSGRELEARVAALDGPGPDAYRRQLAWRDFYGHVLLLHPDNARREFQERYRRLVFEEHPDRLAAWQEGRTGYPLVDAGMRQLNATGYMHNRARLVVGSFLTKDLHVDWRHGEAYFMRKLLCGCVAQNNGNWQWIAGVGVDPQPFYRRMYNPRLHQERFDPDGTYVRRWVPELAGVPLKKLTEPWTMSKDEQREAGCVIGRDYPRPIVDHAAERVRASERYRAATEAADVAVAEGLGFGAATAPAPPSAAAGDDAPAPESEGGQLALGEDVV